MVRGSCFAESSQDSAFALGDLRHGAPPATGGSGTVWARSAATPPQLTPWSPSVGGEEQLTAIVLYSTCVPRHDTPLSFTPRASPSSPALPAPAAAPLRSSLARALAPANKLTAPPPVTAPSPVRCFPSPDSPTRITSLCSCLPHHAAVRANPQLAARCVYPSPFRGRPELLVGSPAFSTRLQPAAAALATCVLIVCLQRETR